LLSTPKFEITGSAVKPQYERRSLSPHRTRAVAVTVVDGPDQGRQYVPTEVIPVSVGRAAVNQLQLQDSAVDLYHVEFSSAAEGVRVCDLGARGGVRIGSVRILDAIVPSGAEVSIGETRLCVEEVTPDVSETENSTSTFPGIVCAGFAMRDLQRRARALVSTESHFLIEGEAGTGKELFARGVHDLSPRGDKPFVSLQCRGKSVSALAAELFGYEKGAFPGADRQHIGAFEHANGGTLMLRDVGDLHVPMQASVFSALKHRRMRRLGNRAEINLDLRVTISTRRDIRAQVNRRGFRDDLYEILAATRLFIPPLRERPEDIDPLVAHFLAHKKDKSPLGEATLRAMREHRWSGNVEELKSVVFSGPGPT